MGSSSKLKKLLIAGLGIFFGYAIYLLAFTSVFQREFIHNGKIEEICSDVDTLKRTNRKIVDLLDKLSHTQFFKIFRVKIDNECPFWAQALMCGKEGHCDVCKCNPEEVPKAWLQNKTSPVKHNPELDLFKSWESKDVPKHGSGQGFWHVEDFENENGVFVDLKKNPEAFTGYQGQKIWSLIYGENCFKGNFEDMCIEERMLNKILSGLHTSVSTQLSEFWIDNKNQFRPNMQMFFEKVGEYPDRVVNLYFAYSVLLRALNRAADELRNYEYETGDLQQDMQTKELLQQILSHTLSDCDMPFNEKEIFQDITKEHIRRQFVNYIHNISRIMDCVSCEKCRVYGKMQTYGIGTTLKILFHDPAKSKLVLKRNEIIALVNTFVKFSTSLKFIDQMYERRRAFYTNALLAIVVGVGTFWIFILIIMRINKELEKKFKGQFKILGVVKEKEN